MNPSTKCHVYRIAMPFEKEYSKHAYHFAILLGCYVIHFRVD